MTKEKGQYLVLGVCLLVAALSQPLGAAVIEGFESGNLALYTAIPSSNFTVNATAKHDGSFGLFGQSVYGQTSEWIYRADAAVTTKQGDTFSAWLWRSNVESTVADGGRSYLGFGASAAGTYSAVMAPNTSELIIQKNEGYNFFI